MFTSYYFPATQYGNMNMFACEYIESVNGHIYFNQIKAFECDFNFPQSTCAHHQTFDEKRDRHFKSSKALLCNLWESEQLGKMHKHSVLGMTKE